PCRSSLTFLFDPVPVGFGRLLGAVVAIGVVPGVLDGVGQVLLGHPVVFVFLGVLVVLALDQGVRAVVVLVLQLAGHRPGPARPDVGQGGVDGGLPAVGLGAGGHQDHRVG